MTFRQQQPDCSCCVTGRQFILDDNSQTDTIYLIFIMVEIKLWNSADFEIRTVVSLTVRVQRKRVLVYELGWFSGDRGPRR